MSVAAVAAVAAVAERVSGRDLENDPIFVDLMVEKHIALQLDTIRHTGAQICDRCECAANRALIAHYRGLSHRMDALVADIPRDHTNDGYQLQLTRAEHPITGGMCYDVSVTKAPIVEMLDIKPSLEELQLALNEPNAVLPTDDSMLVQSQQLDGNDIVITPESVTDHRIITTTITSSAAPPIPPEPTFTCMECGFTHNTDTVVNCHHDHDYEQIETNASPVGDDEQALDGNKSPAPSRSTPTPTATQRTSTPITVTTPTPTPDGMDAQPVASRLRSSQRKSLAAGAPNPVASYSQPSPKAYTDRHEVCNINDCGDAFVHRSDLNQHMAIVHRYYGTDDDDRNRETIAVTNGSAIDNAMDLDDCQPLDDTVDTVASETVSGIKYECNECGKQYKRQRKLDRHMARRHANADHTDSQSAPDMEMADIEVVDITENIDRNNSPDVSQSTPRANALTPAALKELKQCERCGRRHLQIPATVPSVGPSACHTCRHICHSLRALKEHVSDKHCAYPQDMPRLEPIQCQVAGCGSRRFDSQDSLYKHRRVRHRINDSEFKCNVIKSDGRKCEHLATAANKLDFHLLKHRRRPHKCFQVGCTAQFDTSQGLSLHTLTDHKGEQFLYQCDWQDCHRVFKTQVQFDKHQDLEHRVLVSDY